MINDYIRGKINTETGGGGADSEIPILTTRLGILFIKPGNAGEGALAHGHIVAGEKKIATISFVYGPLPEVIDRLMDGAPIEMGCRIPCHSAEEIALTCGETLLDLA